MVYVEMQNLTPAYFLDVAVGVLDADLVALYVVEDLGDGLADAALAQRELGVVNGLGLANEPIAGTGSTGECRWRRPGTGSHSPCPLPGSSPCNS